MPRHEDGKPVDPALYDGSYFLRHCGGHEVYRRSRGGELDPRLAIVLQLADIRPSMRVLDLGCGRGELVRHCGERGALCWGLDLAPDALALSSQTLRAAVKTTHGVALCRAAGERVPFDPGCFHRVILSDILEHLTPVQLRGTLAEVHRVLAPGGRAVFHTFPNRWFYQAYYRFKRLLWDLPRGKAGPRNPRTPCERAMHVNELSPLSLRRALRPHFSVRIWCAHRDRWDPSGGRFPSGGRLIDWIREPEIWGVATKTAGDKLKSVAHRRYNDRRAANRGDASH
jgi:SAM-dependent methyltransferase